MIEPKTTGLRVRHQVHQGMRFKMSEGFPGNAVEIITWLGENFIALTDGYEISVDKFNISRSKNEGEGALSAIIIIFKCPITGNLFIAAPNDWIIWDPDNGYKICSDADVMSKYTIAREGISPDAEKCQSPACLCSKCDDRGVYCHHCPGIDNCRGPVTECEQNERLGLAHAEARECPLANCLCHTCENCGTICKACSYRCGMKPENVVRECIKYVPIPGCEA